MTVPLVLKSGGHVPLSPLVDTPLHYRPLTLAGIAPLKTFRTNDAIPYAGLRHTAGSSSELSV